MTTAQTTTNTAPDFAPLYYCGDERRYHGDRVNVKGDKPRPEDRLRVRVRTTKHAPRNGLQVAGGYVLAPDAVSDIVIYRSELPQLQALLPDDPETERARVEEANRDYARKLDNAIIARLEHESGGVRGPTNTTRPQLAELLAAGDEEAIKARKRVLEVTSLSFEGSYWELHRVDRPAVESVEVIEKLDPPETAADATNARLSSGRAEDTAAALIAAAPALAQAIAAALAQNTEKKGSK